MHLKTLQTLLNRPFSAPVYPTCAEIFAGVVLALQSNLLTHQPFH